MVTRRKSKSAHRQWVQDMSDDVSKARYCLECDHRLDDDGSCPDCDESGH